MATIGNIWTVNMEVMAKFLPLNLYLENAYPDKMDTARQRMTVDPDTKKLFLKYVMYRSFVKIFI